LNLKEEIAELVRRNTETEPGETEVAFQITLLGYFIMLTGFIWWSIIFLSSLYNNTFELFLKIFFGSILFGTSMFIINQGTIIYFQFHKKVLAVNWVFQGFIRSFLQIYYFGSYLIIFVFAYQINPSSTFDINFFFFFLILAIPPILSYRFSRSLKIRNWIKELVVKRAENQTNLITDT
jgi:hypothetical protein